MKLSAAMIPTNTTTCQASQPRTAHQSVVSARASPTRASDKRRIVPSSASAFEGCIRTAVPAATRPVSSLEPRHPPFRNAAHTPTQFADSLNGRPDPCERSWLASQALRKPGSLARNADGSNEKLRQESRAEGLTVRTAQRPPRGEAEDLACGTVRGPTPSRARRSSVAERIFPRPAKLKPALRPAVESAPAVSRTPASLITFDRRGHATGGAARAAPPCGPVPPRAVMGSARRSCVAAAPSRPYSTLTGGTYALHRLAA